MMKRILFVLSLLLSLVSVAQDTKSKPEWKRDTIIGTNRFAIYNNWLSVGAGYAINTNKGREQFTGVVDYNFHIQKHYFQLGVLLSGDYFGSYTTKQAHACYVLRKENTKRNLSYFGGLSLSAVYNSGENAYNNSPGIYGGVQYIRKLTYDVGVGPSVFADIGVKQTIVGIKLDIYFSGAFKGSTKGKKR